MPDEPIDEPAGLSLSDETLLALVTEAVAADDEPPAWGAEFARQALTWRRVDAELAELLEAELGAEPAVRSPATARSLTYAAAGVVLTVDVDEGGALEGQVEAPEVDRVRVEGPDGSADLAVDEYGVFRAAAPARPFRLTVELAGGTVVVTPWIV
jgi:hypothetical protein